jgi:hypothetical protein
VGPRAALTLTGIVLLLALASLLVVRGGGDDEPERQDRPAAPAPAEAEPPAPEPAGAEPAALRSARALARGFERVTGDRLELDPGEYFTSASYDARTLDEGAQADAYYGNFLLFVYPTAKAARDAARRQGGRWSSYGAGL